jgi:hypothetical protein
MRNFKLSTLVFLSVCFYVTILVQKTSCELNKDNNEIILVDANEDSKSEGSIYTQTGEKFQVSDEEFVATKEWQPLKENQAIPKGRHVRLNLATGQREAKLLDETEGGVETKKTENKERMMSKELEEALMKLNDENNLETASPEEVYQRKTLTSNIEKCKKKLKTKIRKRLEKSFAA